MGPHHRSRGSHAGPEPPRAYFLNVTGSAVSNVLPLGGAAGTALNYSTSRAWGFSTPAFLRWALVTNIWDTLGKLVIPGFALLWLAVDQTRSPAILVSAALGSVALLGVLVLLTWLAVRYDFIARWAGRAMDSAVSHLRLPGLRRRHAGGCRAGERGICRARPSSSAATAPRSSVRHGGR